MKSASHVVYSINVEDLQNVAAEKLSRKLSDKEIQLVETKLGDCIDWHVAVSNAIELSLDDTR